MKLPITISMRGAIAGAAACAAFFVAAVLGLADDLIKASGRNLKPGQEKFVIEKVEALRESDHLRRFDNIYTLIRLDSLAVPFLREEMERGSNPIPVRCAILALAEIAPPGLADDLSALLRGSKKGRDEKAIAALGLGRLSAFASGEAGDEADLLRKHLKRGEERLLRKSAALALARMGDEESFKDLQRLASQERDERMAVTFMLAAVVAGGDGFKSAAPDMLASLKGRLRRAAILGCAFHDDPILRAALVKHGRREKENLGALAIALGRYRGEDVTELLVEAVSGQDEPAAANACYSLALAGGTEAGGELADAFKRAPRTGSLRRHILLAAAEAGLTTAFAEQAVRSLADPDAEMRSAAALALVPLGGSGSVPPLLKAFKAERDTHVAGDILIAVGLLGTSQDALEVDRIAETAVEEPIRIRAGLVSKVMTGKTDRAVLEEEREARLAELSGRWRYRFRDAFLDEVGYGMELDTILRRVDLGTGDIGTVEDGGDQGDSGSEGTGSESGVPTPEQPAQPDGGAGSGGGSGSGTVNPPSGSFVGGNRRVILRGEVVEWDILHWFNDLQYFPDGFFAAGP